MKLIVNGIYTTNTDKIILIEEITEKLVIALSIPILHGMNNNKDVSYRLNNISLDKQEMYRSYFPIDLFENWFGEIVDGYLGVLKEE